LFRQRLRAYRGDQKYETIRLHVRRTDIFIDSYHQLRHRSAEEMRGKLAVQFVGEDGMDAGGLTREWFETLAKEMFNPTINIPSELLIICKSGSFILFWLCRQSSW